MKKRRNAPSLLAAEEQRLLQDLTSDAAMASEKTSKQEWVDIKRSILRNGLTDRELIFILEKLVGLNDKNAALAAGYSLSVAENTKQRIWNRRVIEEFKRLATELEARMGRKRGDGDEEK
jgi:hypothetical protein